ncbi:MAG: TolC family protein, partial [Acidobacteria bacterium]|nr:TolC family protein [Acidobacteriota bacterium]
MWHKSEQKWCWSLVGLVLWLGPAALAAQESARTAQVRAQMVAGGMPASSLGAALVLDELIREALENNPAVHAALRRVEAQRRRVPQARALPDPRVSVGWMGNLKPFGVMREDPSSYRSVGATQEIPFPGKLKLRGEVADREAEAVWWDYEATRRRVVA